MESCSSCKSSPVKNPNNDFRTDIGSVTSNRKQTTVQLPVIPSVPEKSLFTRCITYAEGILATLINWQKTEFLYTEEFIHRLLSKEQSFAPDTLYVVRANLPEEDQAFFPCSAYELLIDPHFCGTVDLSGKHIDQWPEKLRINGSLNLSESSIDRLPEILIVNGNLNLSGCQNLKSLSEIKTVVDGELIARNSGLKSIRSELQANSIDLTGSAGFGEFGSANQFTVPGEIILDGCRCLSGNLPNWLFTMGPMPNGNPQPISLCNTGISAEAIESNFQLRTVRCLDKKKCVLTLDSLNGLTINRII